MANAVINLDLPWNPAKLEQRIARAWRKGQKSVVTVINFVTENSIEHSILHLLSQKQTLADGVLDGVEDYSKIAIPSGRTALIERMQAALDGRKPIQIKPLPPEEALVEDIRARHGLQLLHAELRAERLVVVLDAEPPLIVAEQTRLAASKLQTIAPLGRRCNGLRQPGSSALRKHACASSIEAKPAELTAFPDRGWRRDLGCGQLLPSLSLCKRETFANDLALIFR